MNRLSVFIIAKNESADIGRCLESVKGVADEIVVVDDFSSDNTVEIARKYTDKIYLHKFESYGAQKQFALDKSSFQWALNLDADEELTFELGEEIKRAVSVEGEPSGYELNFSVHFLGKQLKFGRSAKEKHLRLFKKKNASYQGKTIHEGIVVAGKIGRLKGPVRHYTYSSLEEYFEKFNRYTSLIAMEKFNKGERFKFYHLFRFHWEFVTRYIVKFGFLDGWHGFLYALLSAWYTLIKYLKLWDIQRKFNS